MKNRSKHGLENDELKIQADARLRLAARLLASVPVPERSTLSAKQALDLAEQRALELDRGEVRSLDYRNEIEKIRQSLAR